MGLQGEHVGDSEVVESVSSRDVRLRDGGGAVRAGARAQGACWRGEVMRGRIHPSKVVGRWCGRERDADSGIDATGRQRFVQNIETACQAEGARREAEA